MMRRVGCHDDTSRPVANGEAGRPGMRPWRAIAAAARRAAVGLGCLLIPGMWMVLAFAPAARADVPLLIVPGQIVGPVRLGMRDADVRAALGRPIIGRGGELVFPGWGISVNLLEGAAVKISTTNPAFRTETGAGVATALTDTERLIGDHNEVITRAGGDTTILFPFQGIGFVFRGTKAVQTYIIPRIPLGPITLQPPPTPATAEGAPGPSPGPASAPPAAAAPAQPAGAAAGAKGAFELRGLGEAITGDGQFQATGQLVNLGPGRVGPVTVTVTFDRASGDSLQRQTMIQGPVDQSALVGFTVSTAVGSNPIVRYTAQVSAEGFAAAQATRAVPVSAYTNLAIQQITVGVQLGAPASAVNGVQAFVSITSTGSIPIAWVRDVTVQVPFGTGSSQTVHIQPGQTQMILVPSVPGPASAGSPGQLIGNPKVIAVVLGTS